MLSVGRLVFGHCHFVGRAACRWRLGWALLLQFNWQELRPDPFCSGPLHSMPYPVAARAVEEAGMVAVVELHVFGLCRKATPETVVTVVTERMSLTSANEPRPKVERSMKKTVFIWTPTTTHQSLVKYYLYVSQGRSMEPRTVPHSLVASSDRCRHIAIYA